jgi:hypothetical protein
MLSATALCLLKDQIEINWTLNKERKRQHKLFMHHLHQVEKKRVATVGTMTTPKK